MNPRHNTVLEACHIPTNLGDTRPTLRVKSSADMAGNEQAIAKLKAAFNQRNLSLYLGAGVSVASGIPSWNQLVLALYFRASAGDWKSRISPFPNYLYAIAEWQLKRDHEPLEITARKIRQFYPDAREFLSDLRATIYAGLSDEHAGQWENPDPRVLRNNNATLDGVAGICEKTNSHRGVRAVITYNYDNLVETVTAREHMRRPQFVPIWNSSDHPNRSQRPIVHVHGYIPPVGDGSLPDEIVFTEDQYHAAAHSPYSWSNLAQIQCLSSSVGLMIGLSLSDRNMRRLLDALRIAPFQHEQFALLRRPKWQEPNMEELDGIHHKAISYRELFARSGAKVSGERYGEMLGIFGHLNDMERSNYSKVLGEMGITPIWVDNYDEVGEILNQIARCDPA